MSFLNLYSIENENEHSNTDGMNELDNKSSSLFCQSILGGTASALFVQNVGLSWGALDANDHLPPAEALRVKTESHTQINRVIAKLPNVRSLWLSDSDPSFNPFKPDFISNAGPSNFRVLSDVTVYHLSFPREALATPIDTLYMYLQLPALEVLETQYTKVTTPTDYDHQPRGPKPALSRVPLGAGHLRTSVVHSLLLRTAAVKFLECKMPGTEKKVFEILEDGNESRVSHIKMEELLSPAGVISMLQPIRTTLVHLNLTDSAHDDAIGDPAAWQWRGHDGSRSDFSEFIALEHLRIPSTCFFPSGDPTVERDPISFLLPHSLKHLQVSAGSHVKTTFWILNASQLTHGRLNSKPMLAFSTSQLLSRRSRFGQKGFDHRTKAT